jgi:hypothetical protein
MLSVAGFFGREFDSLPASTTSKLFAVRASAKLMNRNILFLLGPDHSQNILLGKICDAGAQFCLVSDGDDLLNVTKAPLELRELKRFLWFNRLSAPSTNQWAVRQSRTAK